MFKWDRVRLKQEYSDLYRNLQQKVVIFEDTKTRLERLQEEIETKQRNQMKEIEGRKIEVFKQEQLLLQKLKVVELKECEMKVQEHKCTHKVKYIQGYSENDVVENYTTVSFDMAKMKTA